MRVWDVNPGYLNRQNLLGEHREIHGLFSVIKNKKKGYARHPETLRWYGKLKALKQRHDLLVSEMTLRGYRHHSPMADEDGENHQKEYVDFPYRQFKILKEKYKEREGKTARIPLPINCQQLWAQHKYSVLARDPEYYQTVGPLVSKNDDDFLFRQLSQEFVERLAVPPPRGRLMNAIQHMWGYVSSFASLPEQKNDLQLLMDTIRTLAFRHRITYLMESTALSDLYMFASGGQGALFIKTAP